MAVLHRYAINDASADWGVAEAQVTRLAKGGEGASVISVKMNEASAGQKRKTEGRDEKKTTRRSKKAKR